MLEAVDDSGSPICERIVTSEQYRQASTKVVNKANCGIVYTLDNEAYNRASQFKVMKDSASTLIVGSAMALAAMLAF